MHGNPWLRLLRREVEALVEKTRGTGYLKERQVKTELTRINGDLQRLKREIAVMEERKSKLLVMRAAVLSGGRKNSHSQPSVGRSAASSSADLFIILRGSQGKRFWQGARLGGGPRPAVITDR